MRGRWRERSERFHRKIILDQRPPSRHENVCGSFDGLRDFTDGRRGGSTARIGAAHSRRDLSGREPEAGARESGHATGVLRGIFRIGARRRVSQHRSGTVLRHGNRLDAWDALFGQPRPAELHPFREFHAGTRHAIATPGDLLFHIRAKRMDLCFELATQIMARRRCGHAGGRGAWVSLLRRPRHYRLRRWDRKPARHAASDSAIIGAEDAGFAGGSYVIVQKYLHDLTGWNALSTEAQELIIGRKKLSDIELDDAVKPTCAHSALTVIEENGKEVQDPARQHALRPRRKGEFGTYFIGYCRTPRITEQMLENMFVGTAARQLRPAAGFQPGRHRQPVFRAVGDLPGQS